MSSRYFVTFIDEYSRKVYVYGIKYKSMVVQTFKDFKTMAESQRGKKIKILRTNIETEYCIGSMEVFLRASGIIHQTTAPYTPEQNVIAVKCRSALACAPLFTTYSSGLNVAVSDT